MVKYNIVSLIPARSGSKSIKDKNIIDFNGKPMIAYTIEQSLNSKYIDETYVSTDSNLYREIALKYGANVPYLRPSNISTDLSTDYEVFKHFLDWLKDNGHDIPDVIVHLRVTYPTRKVVDIDKAIEEFIKNYEKCDSLRSIVISPITPYKMWVLPDDTGYLRPLLKCDTIHEPYNKPRQELPVVYWQNACIDIVKTSTVLNKKSMTGDEIYGFIMDKNETYDIDELIDLERIKIKDKKC